MDQTFGPASLLTTLFPLAVILACLMAVAYFGRRLKSGRFARGRQAGSEINILATRACGAQASLMIIEAEGHRFLVSAGRHGIRHIGDLGGPQPLFASEVFSHGDAGPA